MDKNLKLWHIGGIIFVIVLGTLLHFVYQWSGKMAFVGVFGAVNESVWEHLKLLLWPTLIYGIIEFFVYKGKYKNFFVAKFLSILTGILSIVVIFYTYTGIIGTNYFVMDILTFIIAVLASQYVSFRILRENRQNENANLISIVFIVIFIILFIVFTFKAPHIPLFQDPTNGYFGI